MTGHVYDGIQEYDNPLPGWWTALFWGTIVFTFAYLFVSLVRSEWTSTRAAYEREIARNLERQFATLGELTMDRDTLLSFVTDPEQQKWLAVGSAIFQTNCVSCHGRDGSGVTGPNMTDDHYLLVKTIEDIPKTIVNGSAAKGMPAWGNRLMQNEIVLVAAYIASLRGQNVPSPRPAEGEVIPPFDAPSPAAAAAPAPSGN
ncbi:MAG: cbb3-type cytochrome c oxidase N-terminal domain-containing protein [Planctomycetota bacterium]